MSDLVFVDIGYQDYSDEPCDPAIYDDCDASYEHQAYSSDSESELTGHCKGECPLSGEATFVKFGCNGKWHLTKDSKDVLVCGYAPSYANSWIEFIVVILLNIIN